MHSECAVTFGDSSLLPGLAQITPLNHTTRLAGVAAALAEKLTGMRPGALTNRNTGSEMHVMTAADELLGHTSVLRRSQRLHIGLDVLVSISRGKEFLLEETKTLLVSVHGALIPLRMKVAVGETLNIKNIQTRVEVPCRIISIEHASDSGLTEVGIEFIDPAPRFWGIFFPPTGWTPRHEEAKKYTPPPISPPVVTKT